MIIDSSAVIAILLEEPDHEDLVTKIAGSTHAGIGTPTLVECGVVLSWRMPGKGRVLLERFLQRSGIMEVPFTQDHWRVAQEAFERLARGAIVPA